MENYMKCFLIAVFGLGILVGMFITDKLKSK